MDRENRGLSRCPVLVLNIIYLFALIHLSLANLVKEWKVIKRSKILGAPGQYVDAGEIVNEEESEDEDGLVQIRTMKGVTGCVKKVCLGKIVRCQLMSLNSCV